MGCCRSAVLPTIQYGGPNGKPLKREFEVAKCEWQLMGLEERPSNL